MENVEAVEKYIARYDEPVRGLLQGVRQAIRAAAPDARERIGYGMPSFYDGETLVYYAAMKNHIGLYPTGSGVAAFAERLKGYRTSKGAIRFSLSEPLPYDLIRDITAFRAAEAKAKRNR